MCADDEQEPRIAAECSPMPLDAPPLTVGGTREVIGIPQNSEKNGLALSPFWPGERREPLHDLRHQRIPLHDLTDTSTPSGVRLYDCDKEGVSS